MPEYIAKYAKQIPELKADWNDAAWNAAEIGEVANLWKEDGKFDFVPRVHFRLMYNEDGVYGIYQVEDHYVKAVHNGFQDSVCQDSCAEFFFGPNANGYFNLEMNAGGNFLIYYVRDCTRDENGIKDYSELTREDCAQIKVVSTLPRPIDPEITEPTTWCVQFMVPRTVMEKYAGAIGTFKGQSWKGNFYKCADLTSHPHWIAWSPVSELNFHLPKCFGDIKLA